LDASTFLDDGEEFMKKYGVKHVRGCHVIELFDDSGANVYDFNEAKIVDSEGESRIESGMRTIRVLLDSNQYALDTIGGKKNEYDIYGTFNVLVRRGRSNNNFKSILETMRDLMIQVDGDAGDSGTVPEFMHDVLLGYGKRDGAHYSQVEQIDVDEDGSFGVDFRDTFVDRDHLYESFPDMVCHY
jgi:intron-binding protein aquarius